MIIEDDVIMLMKQNIRIKPRRGEINATPSGLLNRWWLDFYNHYTPTGFCY